MLIFEVKLLYMRLLLSFLFVCTPFLVVSQDIERVDIVGKVVVEGSDIEGITIFNATSNHGVVTDGNGEFRIAVALNDVLQIRALIYQDIDVRVNQAVVDSRTMSVYLIEEMVMLDEVEVNKKLSGILAADASRLETYDSGSDAFYYGYSYAELSDLGDDNLSQMDHIDRNEQGKQMVHGLNIVNVVDQLLIPLFRSEVNDKKATGVPEVPAEHVKYYLGSDFLIENFGIPEHRVQEFIRYVEEDDFDFDLLNYGHELELLDLLSKKSETFLNAK